MLNRLAVFFLIAVFSPLCLAVGISEASLEGSRVASPSEGQLLGSLARSGRGRAVRIPCSSGSTMVSDLVLDLDEDGVADNAVRRSACAVSYGWLYDTLRDRSFDIYRGTGGSSFTSYARALKDASGALVIDEPCKAWFIDLDGDGFGSQLVVYCGRPELPAAEAGGDCDDNNASIFPGTGC